MIHVISKFAPMPFYPVGLCVALLIAAIVCIARQRRRAAIVLVALAAGGLWLSSMPAISFLLLGPLERRHYPVERYPRVSAVVLLGGASVPGNAPRAHPETNQFGDRLMHAVRVFRTGCAPYLICTGGKLEFLGTFEGSDAGNSARLLRELFGVDSSRILLGNRSRNTREDAQEVVRLLGERGERYHVILVTSAFHMDRTSKVFRRAGIEVLEAPTDYAEDSAWQWHLVSFLPSAEALNRVSLALHEYYGILAYRMLGWI